MTQLPVLPDISNVPPSCWNQIGVWGDRTCPELRRFGHCQNCPIFSAAGRKFLNAPSPPGYVEEWTARLAETADESPIEQTGVLIFRLAEEWLALDVQSLVEVTNPKPIRRIPHRSGMLAGLVNIRGELCLCAHLTKVVGVDTKGPPSATRRMLVVRRDVERWVFPVDEVDQVHRIPIQSVGRPPATVGRSLHALSLGVFDRDNRTVGLLDDERIFEILRTKLR
ncbi:MAG: chemotaxis protein CheW [Bacteroidales bacterium]|nr:chemotaxis protein CheW [Bacteroidales bacterium]